MSGKSTSTIQRPETPPRASDQGRSRLGDLTRPIPIERRISTHRRSNLLLALVAIGIAVALGAALFGLPVQTYFGQGERIAERQVQVEQLQAVNEDLRREVARLQTDDGVREAAREQLGYVAAGERRESILDFPPVPTDLPNGWPYSLVNSIVELRTASAAADAGGTEPTGSQPVEPTAPAP